MAKKKTNPPKFDRCVKDVKRKGGAANAYAVCTAAGTRNRGKRPKANKTGSVFTGVSRRKRKNFVPIAGGAELLAQQGPVLLQRVGRELRIIPAGKNGKRAANRSTGRKAMVKRVAKRSTRRNAGRRNPLDESRKVYAEFHGRESEQTVEITTPIHQHTYLSGIGELEKLVIRSRTGHEVILSQFGGAILAQNEKPNKKPQLYIEGGDQAVDLQKFGIGEPVHEEEVLGELVQIHYYTVKDHLGNEGGEAVYFHKFSKPYPTVNYDTVNRLLTISGGKYSILVEGISD